MLPDDARQHPVYTSYYITPDGDVYKGVTLKKLSNKDGYRVTFINNKQKYVHRLVAETFLPNPHNLPQVNHINGDKSDNSVSNLEWCSASHNKQHSHDVIGYKYRTWEVLHCESGAIFTSNNLHLTADDFGVKYKTLMACRKYKTTRLPIKVMGVVDEG